MLSETEKNIVKLLKEKGIEKDTIIPTMLVLKDNEKYQSEMLRFLESVEQLDEETLINETEKMGFLQNNPNVL